MTTPLVIIGAGGFGREVHDVVEAINAEHSPTGCDRYELLGFIDDGEPDLQLLAERGAEHLGGLNHDTGRDALSYLPADCQYVIGIGDGAVRRRVANRAAGLQPATLIHPRATLGHHGVEVGPGSVICAGVVVTTNVRLGRHCHLNLGVTVGHETQLGDFVTVHPQVAVSGNVVIHDEVTVGTGASIIPGVTIGRGATIGAGAAVVRTIPAGVTAVGVPAKPR